MNDKENIKALKRLGALAVVCLANSVAISYILRFVHFIYPRLTPLQIGAIGGVILVNTTMVLFAMVYRSRI